MTATITGMVHRSRGAVSFGSTAASSFTVNSSTSITARAPPARTVDVTVTTPGGTSATSVEHRFTYVPAPAVTGVSPPSGLSTGRHLGYRHGHELHRCQRRQVRCDCRNLHRQERYQHHSHRTRRPGSDRSISLSPPASERAP